MTNQMPSSPSNIEALPPFAIQLLSTPPVSQRTRSHKPRLPCPPVSYPPATPIVLQSQARALPFTPSHHFHTTIPPSPLRSPVAGRTRRQLSQKYTAPFSPYPSPLAITGATRRCTTKHHLRTVKFPSINTHPQLFSPYSQGTQKVHTTHKRKKAKPY